MGLGVVSGNLISTTYHSVERVGTESILPPGTLLDKPENQDYEPDNRDKRDQQPPTRFIQVVQSSNAHSYGWQQKGQSPDGAENAVT